jgi:peptide/nickel transport system substrate-binding protein
MLNPLDFRTSRRSVLAGATAAAVLPLLGKAAKADDTPKKGGRFRMALAGSSTTDTFEPGSIWDTGIQNISAQVRDLMTEVSPDGQLVPALAESWEPSKDATTWSFKLRKGVEFHNGKSFTSQDVLFTMNHHLKPDSISGAKGVLANVAEVKADGANGVIYTLKKPDADFGYTLSDYHMVIMQDGTTDWNT